MSRPVAAILVAAGRSRRMGSDKLWIDLWGRPAWRWSLDTLLADEEISRVALVVAPDATERFAASLPAGGAERVLVLPGGDDRADSVIAGIWGLTRDGYDDETLLLVHDAARPGLDAPLVRAVIDAARDGEAAVVPVVPIPDSLKRVRSERVVGAVERAEVAAAQTPQAARLGVLRAAIEEAHAWGRPITDDAGALAAAGVPVRVVPGDAGNRKLTEPADLSSMRAMLATRAMPLDRERSNGQAAGTRCGIGFDAHSLEDGRRMVLAGVGFDDEPRGPSGHSDGDAALHALIDALLGAAGLGDVGTLFPSGGSEWEGADSAQLVKRAVGRLHEAGWRPSSADIAVAIDRPAVAPHRTRIAARVSELLGIDAGSVWIKGTTTDGLGVTAGGGVAAWAVACIERRPG